MNAGFCGSAPILTIASSRVASTLGLAGLLKPMWLSEIWRNVNPLAAAFASEIPSIDDRGTPPDTVHNTPVPAQSMHSKAPRLLTPSFSSSAILSLLCCRTSNRTRQRPKTHSLYSRRTAILLVSPAATTNDVGSTLTDRPQPALDVATTWRKKQCVQEYRSTV